MNRAFDLGLEGQFMMLGLCCYGVLEPKVAIMHPQTNIRDPSFSTLPIPILLTMAFYETWYILDQERSKVLL